MAASATPPLGWPFEPWVVLAVAASTAVYVRGWRALRRRDLGRWPASRLAAFLAGQACIYLALASPLEALADRLLQAHMAQHLLLMMAAPPLLWLSQPFFPMVRGLPASVRREWVAPLVRSRFVVRLATALTHPAAALPVFTAITWAWHLPRFYDLALASEGWHYVQHACFLAGALLFWYPVVRPYPARPTWSPWLLLPYLLLADLQNTVLSALLAFSPRPLYSWYAALPPVGRLTPLEDQAAAGVLMWVPGSVVYLGPLFAIAVGLMFGREVVEPRPDSGEPDARSKGEPAGNRISLALASRVGLAGRIALPLLPTRSPSPRRFDLLRLPLLGPFLRWRHARLLLQSLLFVAAVAVIYDGLSGPQTSGMNLAGVLPWVHWRGFLVLGLLAVGNVFCLGCPFLLPRTLARRWLPAGRPWPRWLRNKGPAVALLLAFFWAYEAFALWDRPWLTAWIAVGYFLAPLLLDGIFRGAPFCKHVCPIGQFNFVQSLLAPFEVRVREPATCGSCRTKDCIRGRPGLPGCELGLFLPRKAGNLDCTTCLACVHACPHDNVGLLPMSEEAGLVHDRHRSGVGRLGRRRDVAILVVVLTFAAFANAAGMVRPVTRAFDRWTTDLGLASRLPVVTAFYLAALVAAPAALLAAAAWLSRTLGRLSASAAEVATRLAYALAPLGFAMWFAHYGFHLVTSYDAAWPVAQRFAGDLGVGLGEPDWPAACCCRPEPAWLHDLEVVALTVGLLGSLHVARRVAGDLAGPTGRGWLAWLPWAGLLLILFSTGVWVVGQPMEMRGTLISSRVSHDGQE